MYHPIIDTIHSNQKTQTELKDNIDIVFRYMEEKDRLLRQNINTQNLTSKLSKISNKIYMYIVVFCDRKPTKTSLFKQLWKPKKPV